MASIKEAVENAIAFAQATLGPDRMAGARLEEIESTTSAGEDAWLITLSMISPSDSSVLNDFASLLSSNKLKREYKTFTVRKRDGEVTSMKIRELAVA
jgi:hypothetical protein